MSRAQQEASLAGISIHDSVVSTDHREFYEGMLSDLNIVIPICNQGKCRAIEISAKVAERDQLLGLMKRAETFSRRLLEVTRELFSDFYQAKARFSRAIHLDTAYIKVNLVDRNLLERTCDVRWWALETSFAKCLAQAEAARSWLGQLSADRPDQHADGTAWPQLQSLLDDSAASLACPQRRAKLSSALDNLAHGRQAGPGQQGEALVQARDAVALLEDAVSLACTRLEDIRRSYTLYRDLVICDREGHILASSNAQRRGQVLGLKIGDEHWFCGGLALRDCTLYHAQDLGHSRVEPDTGSLVYSTAIRCDAGVYGEPIGVLGIFFDFQDEARIILDDFMPKSADGSIADGWFSLLTDHRDVVIASSDDFMFPVAGKASLPRAHRQLKKGQRACSEGVIGGREAMIYSAATDGYLDYPGLGWTSHLIVDRRSVFSSDQGDVDDEELSCEALLASRLIPDINRRAFEQVQDDKSAIQRISLNGIIFASKLGKRGLTLGPVFEEITRTGDAVTTKMEQLLGEMALSEFRLCRQALANSARQAIELIDRNLFERAADVRWWATDEYFWTALMRPEAAVFARAGERLAVINDSYTMYRNLVLVDGRGRVMACSRPELGQTLAELDCSTQRWFLDAMATRASTEFVVQDVHDSILEPDQPASLIYAGGIRAHGARTGDAIGVLAILFDWQTEADKILQACLPHTDSGEGIPGCLALYTDRNGRVIQTTGPELLAGEARLELPQSVFSLPRGQASSPRVRIGTRDFLAGSARTRGYREYRGLGWLAHILRPM